MSRGMGKENMVHIYNETLLSYEKEGNNAICSNVDRSGGHYAKRNVRQVLYDITYMWNLKKKYNKLVSITERQTHRYRGQVSDSHWEAGRQYRYGSMRGANSGF